MGILIKKRQAGGGLFADPRYIVLNANTPTQQPTMSRGRNSGGSRNSGYSRPTKKSTSDDMEKFLPSDIKFYKQAEAQIAQAIKEGFDNNINFDDTPEYEILLKEKHRLESTVAPQMKSMNKIYESAYKKFSTNAAGDAPAIVNDKAIVQVLQGDEETLGSFKVISTDELLTNANAYRLLQSQEVLKHRHSTAAFSGFTSLGTYADQLISTAYGSKLYNTDLNNNLDNIGYIKSSGKYKDVKGGVVLDLKNIKFDPTTRLITKTNLSNLRNIYQALLSEGSTNLNNYLEHKSIAFLHDRLAKGKIKLNNKENTIQNLKARSIGTQLATKLISNLIVDENVKDKKTSGGGSSGTKKSTKDKHGNIFSDAVVQLLMNTHKLEIDNIDKANPAVSSVMNVLPAAYVQKGSKFLDLGYGDNNKDDESSDASRINRKTIENNSIIQDMKGNQSEMTTYDGTLILDIVDNNDLNNAIISRNANLHVILAPTIKNDKGDIVVNFTNEFTPKILEAIAKTYEKLKDENITEADVAKGDSKILKRATDIAQEELERILGDGITNAPTIRAAFAFNVQYEADGDSIDKPTTGWKVNSDVLYSIIDEPAKLPFTEYAKETVAFIPISTSFWSKMFKQGSFNSEFENKISADRYDGALKATPIVNLLDITGAANAAAFKQYKKKSGGKLASTEDIRNLLFN